MIAHIGKRIFSKNQFQPRILVVDDDPVCQRVHNYYLHTLLGFQVDIVGSSDEALTKYLNHGYQLVLLDAELNGKSGFEISKKIRAKEKLFNKNRTVIFMITSYLRHDLQREYTLAGVDEFITKPLGFEKLNILMKYWLSS